MMGEIEAIALSLAILFSTFAICDTVEAIYSPQTCTQEVMDDGL